jgi:hypothetical protein
MNDNAGTARGGPTAAAVVDDYFSRLTAAAAAAGTPIGPDELAELRAHVDERLSRTPAAAADATRVLAELGEPQDLAHAFAEAAEATGTGTRPVGTRALVGKVLGVPYDVRTPTSERYATRVWDPSNPRVFVPKALGLGWTVNFGALAVKARLVRPDDEDAPFAAVPEGAVRATLAAPLAVAVALGVLVAVRWPGLPATVPVHWGFSGRPDGYGTRGSAVLGLTALAVIPLLLAVWVHVRRRRPFNRVAASAVSLGLAEIALTIFVQILFSLDGGSGTWPTWVGIAGFVVLPFLLLVVVSRLGRAAEQRRDLRAPSSPSPSSKGRAR